MPRDGSGNYTLPVGNPVITGTLIQSPWANSTMSDIAAQLNNVLTRDGVLGPVSTFKLVDGAVATPGLGFNSEPGLGLFRAGTGILQFASANGVTASLNGSNVVLTSFSVFPRTAGVGQMSRLILNGQPVNSANTSNLVLEATPTSANIYSQPIGTDTMRNLTLLGKSVIIQTEDQDSSATFSRTIAGGIALTLDKRASMPTGTVSIWGSRGGLARWEMDLGYDGEVGLDNGSDFVIRRYHDDGTYAGQSLAITRSSGQTSWQGSVFGMSHPAGNLCFDFTMAVVGAKANLRIFGDLSFPNTSNTGGINLAASRGIGWSNWFASGAYRSMMLWNSAEGGNGSGLNCRGTLYLNPGVQAIFRVDVDSGQFNMENNGTGNSTGGWIATSDARVKTGQERIKNALSKIVTLSGYTYFKQDMKGMDGVAPRKAGYIAQEIQAVLPEAVIVGRDEMGTLSVDHNGVIALLIEAVKEQNARIDQIVAQA